MIMIDYAWLIPLVPALCFVIAGLIGKKTPQGGGYIAILGAAIACILSAIVSYDYLTSTYYQSGQAYSYSIEWIVFAGKTINFGIYIDGLSCIMMLFASFISTMIFVYSLGYMNDQGDKKRRYYAEVSLFLTGMMGLVTSGNYLQMFIFWEIMGLCSYLLIGFWGFDHPEAKQKSSAAKKAFLVTRMGDVCLMGGLFILLWLFGTLDYTGMFDMATINAIAADNGMLLTVATLLLFAGVVGKSAQFPLHDWLPDAMAGPTTVSALIHAATMVKAGVYLVARSFPLFVFNTAHGDAVALVIAIIGGFTAIFAASQALNNMNIKKVLAFSTLSQLGYMILALGAGAYLMWMGYNATGVDNELLITLGTAGFVAGVFHMLNHAFFKALLFLCSGSVIHACGSEDMRDMGGLRKKMPITAYTMLLGSLSIAGFPLFSGFWSKDMVLEAALGPFNQGLGFGSWFCVLFALALITAFMTAFYMFRMWCMTFTGEPAEHQHCHGESPASMTAPLCILAIFAVLSGCLILVGLGDVAADALQKAFPIVEMHSGMKIAEEIFTNYWTYVSIALALIGILLGWAMYTKKKINPGKFNNNGQSWLYKLLQNRYYFPELYNGISWVLGYGIARGVDYFDRNVVDGAVNGLSNAVVGSADTVSKAQTGSVRDYAAFVLVGIIALIAVLVIAFYALGGM